MNCSALWVINLLIVTISSFQFPINMIGMESSETAWALSFHLAAQSWVSIDVSLYLLLFGHFSTHMPFGAFNNSSILFPFIWKQGKNCPKFKNLQIQLVIFLEKQNSYSAQVIFRNISTLWAASCLNREMDPASNQTVLPMDGMHCTNAKWHVEGKSNKEKEICCRVFMLSWLSFTSTLFCQIWVPRRRKISRKGLHSLFSVSSSTYSFSFITSPLFWLPLSCIW